MVSQLNRAMTEKLYLASYGRSHARGVDNDRMQQTAKIFLSSIFLSFKCFYVMPAVPIETSGRSKDMEKLEQLFFMLLICYESILLTLLFHEINQLAQFVAVKLREEFHVLILQLHNIRGIFHCLLDGFDARNNG